MRAIPVLEADEAEFMLALACYVVAAFVFLDQNLAFWALPTSNTKYLMVFIVICVAMMH